ncbi:titin [Toxorhynchites rutilus septentrionalis]|uniref:titin n=1 Tax=Toxorhynchites rutilus septentrionalis TaxID=329112 RepID=UPI00247ADAE1|nr:titin [Toxorhynchites rutilus septentrionalis]
MMERFAINILHKQIYKICRLCGVDNPVKFPIIDENETIIVGEDDEATLAKKIEECVGIQVSKDDKMPQNICSLCVDKISDFFEYRLMCAATNLQTRTILNLPLVDPTRKLLTFGGLPKQEVKDIKEDVKKVVEAASSSTSSTVSPSAGKKGRKKRAPQTPSPSPAPTTRIKAAADIVKDEPIPSTPVKALTKKERLKQLQAQKEKEEDRKKKEEKPLEIVVEQKHTRSKRKEPSPIKELDKSSSKPELTVPPPKKIKFEHPCSYCSDEFKTQTELDSHLRTRHVPAIRKFGCASCRETFETILESKDHNLWHQLTRTLYTCFKCKRKYDKNLALIKHMSMNACGRVSRGRPPATLPDVQCRLCNKKFKTQNLYEWHSCFLKPKSKCPKCGKYFVKKQILSRHYMMFCTGTLPPVDPVIVLKEEPVDPSEKSGTTPVGASPANPERRTRRTVPQEPELPKEEREIPFPPPLELAPESSSAPTVSKKKSSRKDAVIEENSNKPSSPSLATEKIASLLDSGAKLDGDTDIATINNLLSSVSQAIASISEAKAKKKKKKKDQKIKERERMEEGPAEVVQKEAPSPTDERTEDEKQAEALAQEVGEMSLDQQLAFCSDKLPMVVLSKTTFKEECTEIDTEPSKLQEPMDSESVDDTIENVDGRDDFDGNVDNDPGFQEEDNDIDEENQEQPMEDSSVQKEEARIADENTNSPADEDEEEDEEEDIPFPVPIKEECGMEEEPPAPEKEETASQVSVEKEGDSNSKPEQLPSPPRPSNIGEGLFDGQLAVTIKKEPGLEEECELELAKRIQPESPTSVFSPLSSLSPGRSAMQSSPKPALILKIKKEKGLLNASPDKSNKIHTIVLNDDDDDDEDYTDRNSSKNKTKVYKKPNILAVKIKQEKFDPSYDREDRSNDFELPGGIQIKRERVDSDDESTQSQKKTSRETEEDSLSIPPRKKSRTSLEEQSSSVVAFDGVRIKQEKEDLVEPVELFSQSGEPREKPKAAEKKKKSKVKINPFALLKQRMAAEAAAKNSCNTEASNPVLQAPSPLPVITNVVGNAPASGSSSERTSPVPQQSGAEIKQKETVITQESSVDEEKRKKEFCKDLPMPIKMEPVDEALEPEENEQSQSIDEIHVLPMPIKVEAFDENPPEALAVGEKLELPTLIKGEHQEQFQICTDDSGVIEKTDLPEQQEVERKSPERVSPENERLNEEPENSTSSISDTPMEAYDQDSQTNLNKQLKDDDRSVDGSISCSEQESQKDGSEKDVESGTDFGETLETQIDLKASTNASVNAQTIASTHAESREIDARTESLAINEVSATNTGEILETQIDSKALTNASEEAQITHAESREIDAATESLVINEVVSCPTQSTEAGTVHSINDHPVPEQSVLSGHKAPSETDLEELQNLLTEGLKTPDIPCPSLHALPDNSSTTATNNAMPSAAHASDSDVATGVMADRIEDELDSLLNNKLEEISDQLKQSTMTPSMMEVATASTGASHDISLAIERELLQEIMPEQTDDALRTEMNQTSDNMSNSMLDVGNSRS